MSVLCFLVVGIILVYVGCDRGGFINIWTIRRKRDVIIMAEATPRERSD